VCVQVTGLKIGDRVMSPFTTSCGDCFFCKKGGSDVGVWAGGAAAQETCLTRRAVLGCAAVPGITCRCSHAQGAACFGWVSQPAPGSPPAGVQGSQAQYVRVPLAEGTLVKVRGGMSRWHAAGCVCGGCRHVLGPPHKSLTPAGRRLLLLPSPGRATPAGA
jgi:threonine dehydrogenase-like Zn-dependent dehydrogenase